MKIIINDELEWTARTANENYEFINSKLVSRLTIQSIYTENAYNNIIEYFINNPIIVNIKIIGDNNEIFINTNKYTILENIYRDITEANIQSIVLTFGTNI